MLIKTHIEICKRVLIELGQPLSSMQAIKLKEGVVEAEKRRGKYEPHHYGKLDYIERYIKAARSSFLCNDLPNAYFYLGFALHYIQDAYTSVIKYQSPNNQIYHQNYERNIENAPFVSDVEREIQYVFRDDYLQMSKYSALVRDLSRNVEGKADTLRVATLVGKYPSVKLGKPVIDLNMAYKASYVISKSVLSPKNCPEVEAILSRILSEHEGLLQNSEFSVSTKIAELVRQRDVLEVKIVQESGFVRKIKNCFYRLKVSLQNRRINEKTRNYNSQSHLHQIAERYNHTARILMSPYEGWYNFQIPNITFRSVKKELLTIAEVSAILGFCTDTVRTLLGNGGHSCFLVGNRELILRSELREVLKRFAPNGIRDYPD